MLIRSQVPGFAHKVFETVGSIIVPKYDVMVPKHCNIFAVLDGPRGRWLIPASNIVTNDGDVHYAERGAAETPTNAFGVHVMATAGTPGKAATYASFTPIAGSEKAHTATYPKTNDGDADNTGAGVDIVTWLATYTKADFNNGAITHGVITNASPIASPPTPLLTGYAFAASFEKTANDTLKVFVNHEMLGV